MVFGEVGALFRVNSSTGLLDSGVEASTTGVVIYTLTLATPTEAIGVPTCSRTTSFTRRAYAPVLYFGPVVS
jgi:hypothetical protein